MFYQYISSPAVNCNVVIVKEAGLRAERISINYHVTIYNYEYVVYVQ